MSINNMDHIKLNYEFSLFLLFRNVIFFSTIFFIIYNKARYISESFFGSTVKKIYIELSERKRIEWDQRIVSMVHAIMVLPFCIISTIESIKYGDIFYYQCEAIMMVLSITTGYFIWDLYVCYKHPKIVGIPMIFHAIMGISSNLYVVLPHGRPAFIPIVAILLMTEISTIPLNLKGFIQVVNSKSKYYNWSLGAFVFTFLSIRCVLGIPFNLYLYYGTYKRWNAFPVDKSIIFLTECTIQLCLNSYWSFLLVKKIFQTYLPSKKTILENKLS